VPRGRSDLTRGIVAWGSGNVEAGILGFWCWGNRARPRHARGRDMPQQQHHSHHKDEVIATPLIIKIVRFLVL
jgi:hypothetical protein